MLPYFLLNETDFNGGSKKRLEAALRRSVNLLLTHIQLETIQRAMLTHYLQELKHDLQIAGSVFSNSL